MSSRILRCASLTTVALLAALPATAKILRNRAVERNRTRYPEIVDLTDAVSNIVIRLPSAPQATSSAYPSD